MKKSKKRTVIIASVCAAVLLYAAAAYGALMFPRAPKKSGDAPVVACVGDSITQAMIDPLTNSQLGPCLVKDGYCKRLQKKAGDSCQVLNFGLSGRTLLNSGDHPYRNEKFFELSQQCSPKVVTIMLGSNDSKPHNWDAQAYRSELRKLALLYKELPSKPAVFLLASPCAFAKDGEELAAYDISPATLSEEIRGTVREVSEETGVGFIDIYAATQSHPEWFSDGVHPNKTGAENLAEVIYAEISDSIGV